MSPSSSFFRSSMLYFFFAFILFAGSVGYGFFQYRALEAEKQAIIDNTARIGEFTEILLKREKEFKKFAEERAKKQAEFSKKIGAILPLDENYTELTRQFDNYFSEYDKPGNPLFQSSLRFGKGSPLPEANGISGLPVSMNIEGTRDNFFKILEFINRSGSLDTGTRLMEVNSIQLNFPEGGEMLKEPSQKINFTVDMTAYYQTPKVTRNP